MSKESCEKLQKILKKTFEDKTKRAVPVFGAGLNIQAFYHEGGALDWDGLLRVVSEDSNITLPKNPSMTARWEAMVQEYASTHGIQANRAEDVLRKKVCETLAERTHQESHTSVIKQQFRDIITLNFDPLLSQACASATLTLAPPSQTQQATHTSRVDDLHKRISRRHRQHYLCHFDSESQGRIWHPHGTIEDRETIVLGIRDYGVYIEELRKTFGCFKGDENKFFKPNSNPRTADGLQKWERFRRGLTDSSSSTIPTSWMDLFMLSDLIFVGCGLGQDEFPLWWVLHQRARNFARYNIQDRPQTIYLTIQDDIKLGHLAHLQNSPAGMEIVAFENHQQMWETLLQSS